MKIVLIGASGYAEHYLQMMERVLPDTGARLCAVVDPYGETAPRYPWLQSRGIPLYSSLEEFYSHDHADLAVICSPIQYHRQQAIAALEQGTVVLCEKPAAATAEEARAILDSSRRTGIPVGIGFQWSFSPTMRALKEDILAGRLGKPLEMKTHIAWKRTDTYYDPKGWKGKLRDSQGRPVMDSIAMNATAHYLHNILYLLGEGHGKAAIPRWIEGGVYRARDIESYDTCVLHGEFAGGCKMLYCASHVTEQSRNPSFLYRFEEATVEFEQDKSPEVTATFRDGSRKVYGKPQSDEEGEAKLRDMIDIARDGGEPACSIETSLAHLEVCGAIFDKMPVRPFPRDMIRREEAPPGVYVAGLGEALLESYATGLPLHEGKFPWAGRPDRVEF